MGNRTFILDRMSNIVLLDENFSIGSITLNDLLQNESNNDFGGFKLSKVNCLYHVTELSLPHSFANNIKSFTVTTEKCENCFNRFDCVDRYSSAPCNNFKSGPTERPKYWPKESLIRYINSKKRREW